MLQEGFFDLGLGGYTPAPKTTRAKIYNCESCGLYKQCQSPKMKLWGQGKKKIMIVMDMPTPQEDANNQPYWGHGGLALQSFFQGKGYQVSIDFWTTYAIICRPSDGKVTEHNVNACRSFLKKRIEEKKPKAIITIGEVAFRSVCGLRISGRMVGVPPSEFFGFQIPDKELNMWVCPAESMQKIIEMDNPTHKKIWESYMSRFLEEKEDFPEIAENIETVYTPKEAKERIVDFRQRVEGVMSFDFETTGIKPHAQGHRILSAAICGRVAGQVVSYAFPFFHDDVEFMGVWRDLIEDVGIGKVAHNMGFENVWSRVRGGGASPNFVWDTMLAAHVLNNKSAVSLKFLTYVNFGIAGFDHEIDRYIKAKSLPKEGSANDFNSMRQAPQELLLTYNAKDALYTFLLYEKQKKLMSGSLLRAFDFFMEGSGCLTDITQNGICFDVERAKKQIQKLNKKIERQEGELRQSKECQRWDGNRSINLNSNAQISELLYDILKFPKPESGAKTDSEQLKNLHNDFCDGLVTFRQLQKIKTYIEQYMREQVEGWLHPFFNLSRVETYRSSSNSPNFQNIPKRNKEANEVVRSCLVPSPGHLLKEYDYKAIEVCFSACYHKDPVMINYIRDPSSDMHADIARQIFLRDGEELGGGERHAAKNGFVFPAFYGSSFEMIAPNMWASMSAGSREHLKKKGIITFSVFKNHIEKIEADFWKNRFKVYQQWKWDVWKEYKETHRVMLHTGFICQGKMKYTEVTNYPIQGTAFHCLLWTLVQVHREMKNLKLKSRIVGQVHDSIIADVHPSEEVIVDELVFRWGTREIRKNWKWIIVPLTIETEATGVGGSWAEMQPSELKNLRSEK